MAAYAPPRRVVTGPRGPPSQAPAATPRQTPATTGGIDLTTAYLGPAGSLSHEAALVAAADGGVDDRLVPVASIVAALDAVEDGSHEHAVVPLEDAVVGGVRETVDHLVHEVDTALVQAKVVVSAELHLAVVPGATAAQVEVVRSHPHALAQCGGSLRRLGIVELDGVGSTSLACAQVAAAGDPRVAALASRRAGEDHGLDVLPAVLNDGEDDHVAFAVVGRGEPVHHEGGKVLLFAVPGRNRPGTIHELLAAFAVRSLNLTRFETRPLSRVLGEYGLVVEVDGGVRDPDLRAAVAELLEARTTVKLLGTYPSLGRAWGRVQQRPLGGRVGDRPSALDDVLGPA